MQHSIVTALLLVLFWPAIGSAHSPHDEIFSIQYSPQFGRDLIIFAIVRFNLVRSMDRGLTWTRLARGLTGIRFADLAVSPAFGTDRTVLAASLSGEIFRSRDGGDSWSRARTQPSNGCRRGIRLSSGFGADGAAAACDDSGDLWSSSDWGDTWHPISPGHFRARCIAVLGNCLLAGTHDGRLVRLPASSSVWEESYRVPGDAPVVDFALSDDSTTPWLALATESGVAVLRVAGDRLDSHTWAPFVQRPTSVEWGRRHDGSRVLFTTTWRDGVFRSDDMGKTWHRKSHGLTMDAQADAPAFRSPHFRRVCVSPDFAADSSVSVAGFDGLFVSRDGGERWMEQRSVLPVNTIVGIDLVPSGSGQSALAVSTYCGGPWLSSDSGRAWRVDSEALVESRLFGIAFSPGYASDSTAFVVTNWAMYRSTDGGTHWQRAPLQAPDGARGSARKRALTAIARGGAIVARRLGAVPYRALQGYFRRTRGALGLRVPKPGFGAAVSVSPTFQFDRTVYVHAGRNLWTSIDGGQSLRLLPGLPGRAIRSLAVSPDHRVDRTVFCVADGTVYRSTDGGESWSHCGFSLHDMIDALAISPEYGRDGTVFIAGGRELFRSRDKGQTWHALTTLDIEPGATIDSILPTSESANGGEIFVHAAGQGLLHSFDGGRTFSAVEVSDERVAGGFAHMEGFPDRAPLVRLSPDYQVDRTIVASSANRVCLSTDGGRRWTFVHVPARYDAARPEIVLRGTWQAPEMHGHVPGRSRRSSDVGATASFDFVGTGVRWIGERGPLNGVADVRIDSQPMGRIDQRASAEESPVTCYESNNLSLGPHHIEIAVVKDLRSERGGASIALRAFEVLSGT